MDFLKSIDPRAVTGILIALSLGVGYGLWRLLKGSIQKAAREEARFHQMEESQDKNREANEKHREKTKKDLDRLDGPIDPNNPWAGL